MAFSIINCGILKKAEVLIRIKHVRIVVKLSLFLELSLFGPPALSQDWFIVLQKLSQFGEILSEGRLCTHTLSELTI